VPSVARRNSGNSVEYRSIRHVFPNVKINASILRWSAITLLGAVILSSVSCMTTYDAYGRPVQSVDPALAVAGVAAAGIIGYAVANNNNNDNYYRAPAPYCGGGGGYYRSYTTTTYDSCY
jgi:hypothetical protein